MGRIRRYRYVAAVTLKNGVTVEVDTTERWDTTIYPGSGDRGEYVGKIKSWRLPEPREWTAQFGYLDKDQIACIVVRRLVVENPTPEYTTVNTAEK